LSRAISFLGTNKNSYAIFMAVVKLIYFTSKLSDMDTVRTHSAPPLSRPVFSINPNCMT